jgi:hypothetical protein
MGLSFDPSDARLPRIGAGAHSRLPAALAGRTGEYRGPLPKFEFFQLQGAVFVDGSVLSILTRKVL